MKKSQTLSNKRYNVAVMNAKLSLSSTPYHFQVLVFDGTVREHVYEDLAPQTLYRVQVTGVVRGSNNQTFLSPVGFDSWATSK